MNNIERTIFVTTGGEYDFSYNLAGGFNDGTFQFLIIKTAFNVLAYEMGAEYVLDAKLGQ